MTVALVSSQQRAIATLRLAALKAAPAVVRPPFGEWLKLARPDHEWTAPHFLEMQRVLDEVTAGTSTRDIFQVPIRHGKTEHNTISYAAYRLEYDPRFRWLIGSYSQLQADTLSREIRTLAKKRGVAMSPERDSARQWETAAGGGVRAVGSGAGVASVNADGIGLDDPIGNRDQAESLAHRDRLWDWLTNDILARCEPHTFVNLTMSRWHGDDPVGRLRDRQGGRWRVLDLPARAEVGDPLGRPLGAALWPALRGEAWLDEKREELGEYGFASLLQGRPRPREGGMFKWEWWRLLDAVPAEGWMVRYWDTAGTKPTGGSHDPDFTCGTLECRMVDGKTAIVNIARFRQSIAQRDASIEAVARADLAQFPGRVVWWVETEAGIAGKDRTDELVRRIQGLGLAVYTEHPTGAKALRAEPLASAAEAGNVLLCPGAWRDAFRSECADFPNGTHDDQVDTAAAAYVKLAAPRAWSPVRVAY